MKDALMGIARHAVTSVGGALVTAGYVDESGLTVLAGAAAVLVGIVFSIVEKKLRKA